MISSVIPSVRHILATPVLHAFEVGAPAAPTSARCCLQSVTVPKGERLRALANALGLDQCVAWSGRTREIEGWYARVAVVVLASRYEGFPNVVLEAMGMGASSAATADRVRVTSPRAAAMRQRLGNAAMAVRERFSAEQVLGRWRQLLAGAARGNTT